MGYQRNMSLSACCSGCAAGASSCASSTRGLGGFNVPPFFPFIFVAAILFVVTRKKK
jgi:hypothetical protein